MKKIALITAILLCSQLAFGRAKLQGWCENGGTKVAIPGTLGSSTQFQQSYVGCTVTVYATGTTNLINIYADNNGTVKANPFTADANTGQWFFYADNQRVDVKFSGGGLSAPITLSDFVMQDQTTLAITNAGVFSGAAMSEVSQVLVNSPNVLSDYQTAQQNSGWYDSEGITSAIVVPNSGSIHQSSAVAGFSNNSSATTNGVGVYGQCIITASGASSSGCYGVNGVGHIPSGVTNSFAVAVEGDMNNVSGTNGAGYGLRAICGGQGSNGKQCLAGLYVGASQVASYNQIGADINNYSNAGLKVHNGTGAGIISVPSDDTTSTAFATRDHGDTLNRFLVTGAGNVSTPGLMQAAYFEAPSGAGDVASQGSFRMLHQDALAWRNHLDNADVLLGINSADQLQVGTNVIPQFFGNASSIYVGTATLTYTAISSQTSQEQTITISGASTSNYGVSCSPRASLGNANLSWSAWVSAANTVSVRVTNATTGSVTPSAVAWGCSVTQ